jgi:transposase
MLRLPANVRIYLATEPCDMRRQFDGLAALVRSGMERDPESGDLYIFRNRRGDMVKALFRDRHGYCMLAKRLARGTFRIEADELCASSALQISAEELAELLSELSLTRGKPFPS